MGNMPVSKKRDQDKPVGDIEAIRVAANLLFPNATNEKTQERFTDAPVTGGRGRSPGNTDRANTSERNETRAGFSDRSDSSNSGLTLGAQPQQIRSMLDV